MILNGNINIPLICLTGIKMVSLTCCDKMDTITSCFVTMLHSPMFWAYLINKLNFSQKKSTLEIEFMNFTEKLLQNCFKLLCRYVAEEKLD